MEFLHVCLIIIALLAIYYLFTSYLFTQQEQFSQDQPELILYYTEWCGYSRSFLPVWEELVKQNKANVKLTKLRCEGGDARTCSERGVNGYPTVILYKGQQEIPFDDDRTVANLHKFLQNHL